MTTLGFDPLNLRRVPYIYKSLVPLSMRGGYLSLCGTDCKWTLSLPFLMLIFLEKLVKIGSWLRVRLSEQEEGRNSIIFNIEFEMNLTHVKVFCCAN